MFASPVQCGRLAVQQKLMRHADIRTTMNIYGDIVTWRIVQSCLSAHRTIQRFS